MIYPKMLFANFEGYNSEKKCYSNCFLIFRESNFSKLWFYQKIASQNVVVCSEIKINYLIREYCEQDGGDVWEAYKVAEVEEYSFNDFSETSFSNIFHYGIPRYSESDFESLINQLGGRKVPETTTKTPDFLIESIAIELKDLQNESMYDKGRRKAIAKIFENESNLAVCLNFESIEEEYLTAYTRLITNSIKNIIKKASTQIKEYSKTNEVEYAGVFLLNTGYFSLEHALFKAIVEDILNRETNTIKFAYIFTQCVLHNTVGDLRSDYKQDFIGTVPAILKPIEQATSQLTERKMSSIFQPSSDGGNVIPPQQPISFFEDGKIFYWKPERLKPSISFE